MDDVIGQALLGREALHSAEPQRRGLIQKSQMTALTQGRALLASTRRPLTLSSAICLNKACRFIERLPTLSQRADRPDVHHFSIMAVIDRRIDCF